MSMQNLSNAIVTQLATLRETKGSISMEDLSAILEKAAGTLSDGAPAVDVFLRDEILKIANHIETTRNEVAALVPDHEGKTSDAAMQLDAILKATEEAAHSIMDAADEIQSIIKGAQLDAGARASIVKVTGRIYEACNFQDLTGQRIKKVMEALNFTEARIRRLTSLFAKDGSLKVEEFRKATAEGTEEAQLLNGPQLPGAAPSQDDIDQLFKNIK